MNILTTELLTRHFDDVVAVDRVGLSVVEGEIFGLLGRNAAGKSTLIKMLTTLLSPSSGTASVAGFDVVKNAAQVRRIIGYVPQDLSADGELTGYENLDIFARLYDIPRQSRNERVKEALVFMGLEGASNRLVNTYSGGMIRRLEIAQSMLHRPRLLFLDEPTVGLDPVARETVWQRIEELRASYGITIFLTTHYMDEAEKLCSRIAIMQAGAIAIEGPVDKLSKNLGQILKREATLTDVFSHYTKDHLNQSGGYLETADIRHTSKRLG